MKLSIRSDSANYACTVVKINTTVPVVGLDKLVKTTIFGNDVLISKDTDINQLYLFFPAECAISAEYLSKNNEFRETTLNKDHAQTGYFADSGRVKAIKFKGVISTGYLAPISTLRELFTDRNGIGVITKHNDAYYNVNSLKEGDEFTDIDGVNICKKYIPKHLHTQGQGNKESRHNKKLKRFDKLVPNQFRFHQDTSHLSRNLHLFEPDQIIVITEKFHGTSAVFSNVLINKELTWYEKILKKLGIDIVTTKYDNLFSSRSVIKNQYINKEQGGGYYGEDIWAIVNKELAGKIETGVSLFGEIVGYLPSGRMIQSGYDYGCKDSFDYAVDNNLKYVPGGEHKFLVYRINYVKPNGEVIEFSWQQIKEYCKKYSIEHVKELYFGGMFGYLPSLNETKEETWQETFFNKLSNDYLEKDCPHCKNKVPSEGIICRLDGKQTYSAFKLKAKRFLAKETQDLDKGIVSIEDEQNNYDSMEST